MVLFENILVFFPMWFNRYVFIGKVTSDIPRFSMINHVIEACRRRPIIRPIGWDICQATLERVYRHCRITLLEMMELHKAVFHYGPIFGS